MYYNDLMIKREDVIKYLKEHARELEDEFVIRRKEKWITRTFQVKEEVLEEFMSIVKYVTDPITKEPINIREAATEALFLFIKKYRR